VDPELEEGMAAVRALVSLGRAAREEVKIRVRQPLRRMYAVTRGGRELDGEVLALLKDELNVKEVAFLGNAEGLVNLTAKPNYRALGPRFQQRTEDVARAIRSLSKDALLSFRKGERVEVSLGEDVFALETEDLEVLEEAREGLVVQGDGDFTAALDPRIDEELHREGLARELVNRIQRMRKDSGLDITDRISLGVFGGQEVRAAAQDFREFIAGETLAREYRTGKVVEDADAGFEVVREVELDGHQAFLGLGRLES
jgi:isoleucyl-tRNA synthetase